MDQVKRDQQVVPDPDHRSLAEPQKPGAEPEPTLSVSAGSPLSGKPPPDETQQPPEPGPLCNNQDQRAGPDWEPDKEPGNVPVHGLGRDQDQKLDSEPKESTDQDQKRLQGPSPPDLETVTCFSLDQNPLEDQQNPPTPGDQDGPEGPRLCGFLQKQGGPLRTWKQRWFCYEEQENLLFYYRTPQDLRPLGRVELRGATLTYPLGLQTGTFHIRTPERTFILKAVNQELRLYWLQQLQMKRWKHRLRTGSTDQDHVNFLPVLSNPLGLLGQQAARTDCQRSPLANLSIKHPLIHIQNSVFSLMRRTSQDVTQSLFQVEKPTTFYTHTENVTDDAVGTPNVSLPRLPPPRPLTLPPLLPLASPAGQSHVSQPLLECRRMKMLSWSSPTTCQRDATGSERRCSLHQDKQMLMEEVKAQKQLVWILHRALEAAQLEKRSCTQFLAAQDEQERLEMLRHGQRQSADLQCRLEEAEGAREEATRSAAQNRAQVVELRENLRELMEKNCAKQEVIVKLTHQLNECLKDGQGFSSVHQLQQEVENLKDDLEAYRIQNKFLNSEIYQLTRLWRTSSDQEKNLMVKCAHLEAACCQVESRYLGILRKLQEVKSLDVVQQEAVQQLIQEALRGEPKNVLQTGTNRDHDEYGFKIVPDYELEDIKLLAKIQDLEIRSHNLLLQEALERPLLCRWAEYLASRLDEDLCPSLELKVMVRAGIPPEYRRRVWCWIVQARTRTIRDHHPNHYQQLCEKSRTSLDPASRQIQLDLHRTLTTNRNFSSPSSPALQQLCRILLAFSWHNPAIGYCQGLNRLAAVSLLVLQSEEEAFWCLVAIVESIMPQDYYTKNLVASQVDQRVLKDFMMDKLPRLAAHFEEHNVDVSLVSFNWFLVVFVESLPSDILFPVWDAFLYEGTKVMFRYALALFKYKEEDILKISDSMEIYQYLRFFTKTISDTRKLSTFAFSEMNPLSRRQLRNRRAFHLDVLQKELCELEEQQKEFITESAEHKDKDVDTVASEDDDDL